MRLAERAALALFQRLDPERAHDLALRALRTPFAPLPGPVTSSRLKTRLAGLDLPNPVGLSAGFDKNAVAVAPLMRAGFGFVEVGAATPHPQVGNPAPRLWRLPEDRAVINRFGFNNEGVEVVARRLAARPTGVPVGLNLGANKDAADRAADFATVLRIAGPYVDFATVNVSSPNTEALRDLQGADALRALLAGVMDVRAELSNRPRVFLKIAPDLSEAEISQIATVAVESDIDGIVATNTTLSRDGLLGAHRDRPGGLSGRPLFARSTEVLRRLARETGRALPLIGVGGVASAEDAYAKIRAGASAIQLYTALSYDGLSLAARIAKDLDALLDRDGVDRVADAVGVEV